PGGLRGNEEIPVKVVRGDPRAGEGEVEGHHPFQQWQVAAREDGADRDRELPAAAAALEDAGPDGAAGGWAGCQPVWVRSTAVRAAGAAGPAQPLEVGAGSVFAGG